MAIEPVKKRAGMFRVIFLTISNFSKMITRRIRKQLCFRICVLWFPASALFAQDPADSLSHANPFLSVDSTTYGVDYFARPVGEIAGAVSRVDRNRLLEMPLGNISNQLQGRVAGLNVVGSGQPGSTSRLRIRGFGSLEANDPLYVVDGVPTQDISSLNPADVETLCVLKDAGSAAIYGSRGANGVIVITTKGGVKGLRVQYNMVTGTQMPGKGTQGKVLDSKEYAELQWLEYKNDHISEVHPIYGSSSDAVPTMPSWAGNTDWYDALTDKAGMQNHDLSLSGGTDKVRFYAGMGYFRQNGIVRYTHNERYSARFNSEWTFWNDRIKAGENLSITYGSKLMVPNLSEDSPILMGPYRMQSIIPVYMTQSVSDGYYHSFEPGDYGGTGIAPRLGNADNVVATQIRNKDNTYHDIRMLGNAWIDFQIVKGLHFRSSFGGTWDNGYGVTYTAVKVENAEVAPSSPYLNENAYWGSDWVWTNLLQYEKQAGLHHVMAYAGYEALRYGMGRSLSGTRSGYYTDAVDFRTLENGAVITAAGSDFNTPTRVLSEFARAEYGYRDRYQVDATIRRDGCSRFGENNRFSMFYGATAAWNIARESFFSSVKPVNDLTLRVSYGHTGNQFAVSPQNAYIQFGSDVRTSYYDLNGSGNAAVIGFYPLRLGNPDLKPERSKTLDIGLSAMVLNRTVGFSLDWFKETNDDLIVFPNLPGTGGEAAAPAVNAASMTNTGLEVELSYCKTWGDLGFNGSIQVSSYRNEISALALGISGLDAGTTRIGNLVRNQEGRPLSVFYGYQVAGIFKDDQEVLSAPYQDGAEPGFFRYENIDLSTPEYSGEQRIDNDDRTVIGNPNPKCTYGIDLALTYRRFDLSAFFYGSKGNDIFNFTRWWTDFWPSFQGQKSHDLLYNSWSLNNTGASVPKASNHSNFSSNTTVNSYYIEDGSYLRLKQVQLGYTLPEKLLGKTGVKSLHFYIQGVNLFTLTKYSGLDPELGGGDKAFGIDLGNYCNAKQFLIGLYLGL
jgi:TonB-dependent starch-binding outer membrane protein SusC